jgi:predicted nucleic acid-binding protein
MPNPPQCVFLDTNVYLIGMAFPESPEAEILRWVGFGQTEHPKGEESSSVEVIVSEEMFAQIKSVARRLRSKDWAGEILAHIWQDMLLRYVFLDPEELSSLEGSGVIPREDAGIYLTAREGHAECFISSNRELITVLARKTGEFECLSPREFVEKYLR